MKLVLGRQNPTFSVVAVQLRADITYSKATVSVIIDERGLNKYARDYISWVDVVTFAVDKGLVDTVTPNEALVLSAVKPLYDEAVATEDISLAAGFNRSYEDTFAAADAITQKTLIKWVLDSVVAQDSITAKTVTALYSDIQTIYDNADANSGDGLEYVDVKPASDPVGVGDQATSSVGKLLQDAVTELETLAVVLSKPLEDTGVVLEALGFDTTKPVADSVAATEAITTVFNASRAFADSTLTTDSLASIGVEKLLTDSMSAVSSGSLRMTDYVDISYLLEDYVGTSTTFS